MKSERLLAIALLAGLHFTAMEAMASEHGDLVYMELSSGEHYKNNANGSCGNGSCTANGIC